MPRPSRRGVWGRPHCQVYHRPGPGRWDRRPPRPARPLAASPPDIQYIYYAKSQGREGGAAGHHAQHARQLLHHLTYVQYIYYAKSQGREGGSTGHHAQPARQLLHHLTYSIYYAKGHGWEGGAAGHHAQPARQLLHHLMYNAVQYLFVCQRPGPQATTPNPHVKPTLNTLITGSSHIGENL